VVRALTIPSLSGPPGKGTDYLKTKSWG